MTIGIRKYYVYRYEGNLNGIEDAVVLNGTAIVWVRMSKGIFAIRRLLSIKELMVKKQSLTHLRTNTKGKCGKGDMLHLSETWAVRFQSCLKTAEHLEKYLDGNIQLKRKRDL